jgi:hypothetical protein
MHGVRLGYVADAHVIRPNVRQIRDDGRLVGVFVACRVHCTIVGAYTHSAAQAYPSAHRWDSRADKRTVHVAPWARTTVAALKTRVQSDTRPMSRRLCAHVQHEHVAVVVCVFVSTPAR